MDHPIPSPEPASAAIPPKRLSPWVVAAAYLLLAIFLGFIAWSMINSGRSSLRIGDPVPSFRFTTFGGREVNSTDFKGKVIVVNFWASWCQPCELEAPDLEAAWKSYQPGGEVIFLGLAYTDTPAKALAYIQNFNLTYPNGPDLRTEISGIFHVSGVPETFIIDRAGNLAAVKIGPYSSLAEIQATIDRILQQ